MKIFLAAALCFFLIIASLFVYGYFADGITESLSLDLEELGKKVTEGNWEEAKSKFFDFYSRWNNKKDFFGIFIDQTKIDTVSENLATLKIYIEAESSSEALAKINSIRMLIYQMRLNEKPTIINIL